MDNDLKDSMKKIEEAKKKQEKIERLIIFLSGVFALVIFAVIGINIYYSGSDEEISKPKIVLEDEEPITTNFIENKKVDIDSHQENEVDIREKVEEKPSNEESKKETKKQEENKTKDKPKINIEVKKPVEKSNNKNKEVAEKNKSKTKASTFSKKDYYYTIQIGAFSSKKRAEKLLKSVNLNGEIVKRNGFYRVYVGKFSSKKQAYKFIKEHKLKGFIRKIKIK